MIEATSYTTLLLLNMLSIIPETQHKNTKENKSHKKKKKNTSKMLTALVKSFISFSQ